MKNKNTQHTVARGLVELWQPVGQLICAIDGHGEKLMRMLLRLHLLAECVRPFCLDPLVVRNQEPRGIFLRLPGRLAAEANPAVLLAKLAFGETQPLA